MRILVRRAATGSYLTSEGQWGPKVSAREFPDIEAAALEALRIEDADVVLAYDDPPCELALNPAYCAQLPRNRPPL